MIITAGIDKSFLGKVQDAFKDIGIPAHVWGIVALVIFTAVGLFLLGKAYNFLRAKFFVKEAPTGWINKRDAVNEVFQSALHQRSAFEMRFLPADQARKSTLCSLEDFNAEVLVLELPAQIIPTKLWMQRSVECFFRLTYKKTQTLHYAFTSTIVGVRRPQKDISHILLSFPEQIQLYQKRAFLRVDPPGEYILGVGVWPFLDKYLQGKNTKIASLNSPILKYVPGGHDNLLFLVNISAGGVRLLIKREGVKKSGIPLNISQRFLFYLDLYVPEEEKKQRFWFLGRLQNSYEDFETRNVELGLQFTSRGRYKTPEDKELVWSGVGADGVEVLAGWVMKRHLELYRKTGLL